MPKRPAIRKTLKPAEEFDVAAPVSVSIQKHLAVIVRGYRDAVRRLVEADRTSDGDAVHIALTEATNWLDSLAEQTPVRSDTHVQAVLFARRRSHHQWGAITYRDDAGVYRWRPGATSGRTGCPRRVSAHRAAPSGTNHGVTVADRLTPAS